MSDRPSARQITRRTFIEGASAVGAGALAVPQFVSAASKGANDRLAIGMIGVGGRGSSHVNDLLSLAKDQNVAITALCDVWKVNLSKSADRLKKVSGKEPRKSTRFGDLLAMKDLDGIVIATPDFGHCSILIAALEAGKDVYVEKPMSLNLEEANKALDLARAKDRVVQAGTQRRSDAQFIAASKLVATGVLGPISRVTAAADFNEARWARGYGDCKRSDVDWDAYLFNRPKRPFDPKLLRRWHLYKLCTNGLSGLWMAHYADAVHMLLGAKYPSSAVAHGGIYTWKDGREHADTFHALLDYPEGFLMSWGMGLGNALGTQFTVHGTQGTLDMEKLILSPNGGAKGTRVTQQAIAAEKGTSHMANWLECIRTRQRPRADIQYGHQHAVATVMAAAAYESGLRQRYDPRKRQIIAG